MTITYLIGNGFDVNIGLQTKYSDFAPKYAEVDNGENTYVENLKGSINEYYSAKKRGTVPEIDWSDMEKGFGVFTGSFLDVEDGDEALTRCHDHLCEELAQYIENEEKRFFDRKIENDIKLLELVGKAFLDYTKGLRPQDVSAVEAFSNDISGNFTVNILDFNYTRVLDTIQQGIVNNNAFGKRLWKNTHYYTNEIREVLHVHGTTDHGMVFGVNDEGQLHSEIFKDEEPERLADMIKPECNRMMGENIEEQATTVIRQSQLIYIYGMSLGETDKRWWERILRYMCDTTSVILIIHSFNAPIIRRTARQFERHQRLKREEFLGFLPEMSNAQKQGIMGRIYVTGENIFSCLKDYVNTVDLPDDE